MSGRFRSVGPSSPSRLQQITTTRTISCATDPKKIPATGLKVVDQLMEGDIQDFLVPALGSGAIPKLQDYGFNGEAAAFFGITLDNTNLVVAQGDIYLVGSLYTDAVCSILAKQLWPDSPDFAGINVDFKNLGIF